LGYVRDQMGVFLEGTFVDSVTANGVDYAVRTYFVTVIDGQLTLLLDDLGGDPLAVINALDILEIGPDTTGPSVIAADPSGEITESFDRFVITFNETIDAGSFTLEDIAELSGPGGSIAPLAIQAISGGQFEIHFAPQTTPGEYTLILGPNIRDLTGNVMDQNADGILGEDPLDQFELTINLAPRPPFEAWFDFGTAISPVAAGYTQVLKNTTYSATRGFGWLSGSVDSRDRGAATGDALTRDFNYTTFATFAVDVPVPGEYEVTITLGDSGGYLRDQMGIFLEGQQVDSVTASGSAPAIRTYTVTVLDGQLTLLLDDLGGDPLVMINGLVVREVVETSGLSVSTSSLDQPDTQSDHRAVENLALDRPFNSLGQFLPEPLSSRNLSGRELQLWARMDSPNKPKSEQRDIETREPALENALLLDQVFSTSLPIVLDQLEQLGRIGLNPLGFVRR
jgi:hypothetical protein